MAGREHVDQFRGRLRIQRFFPGQYDLTKLSNQDRDEFRGRRIRSQTPRESPATVEELSMRQAILETVVAASFDLDGVLAELDNERARLSELRVALQARRDRAVDLANVANLITGTGLGMHGECHAVQQLHSEHRQRSWGWVRSCFFGALHNRDPVAAQSAEQCRQNSEHARSTLWRRAGLEQPLSASSAGVSAQRRVKEKLVDRASISSWLSGNRPGEWGLRALQRLITRSHFSFLA